MKICAFDNTSKNMTTKHIAFSRQKVAFHFNATTDDLQRIVSKDRVVIVTDENVYQHHKNKLKAWPVIILKPGEAYKVQPTVDNIIEQLIALGADRSTFLVGVGGGVVTDITGYTAGIYMRGIRFGFLPTSLLAMVDAAIGGKNGIDVGLYKNMVGLIRQPEFILYDYRFLKSLPEAEWINGFSEIIKHACIKSAPLFSLLEEHTISSFRKNNELLQELIQRNVLLKSRIVQQDEFEQGDRKLLNFGHTFGHAIENSHNLPHGHAVAIGMVVASALSEEYKNFKGTARITSLLKKYKLPVRTHYDVEQVLKMMQSDKKRVRGSLHYVLLEKIGKGIIQDLSIEQIKKVLQSLA